jgi:hypothetical protein
MRLSSTSRKTNGVGRSYPVLHLGLKKIINPTILGSEQTLGQSEIGINTSEIV